MNIKRKCPTLMRIYDCKRRGRYTDQAGVKDIGFFYGNLRVESTEKGYMIIVCQRHLCGKIYSYDLE